MGLFHCRGCDAREKEISHLLALLAAQRDHTTKLAGQLCEIMSPGVIRRAAPPPAPIPATTARVKAAAAAVVEKPRYPFPGYEPAREERAVPELG